jgi:hypothetical protein
MAGAGGGAWKYRSILPISCEIIIIACICAWFIHPAEDVCAGVTSLNWTALAIDYNVDAKDLRISAACIPCVYKANPSLFLNCPEGNIQPVPLEQAALF